MLSRVRRIVPLLLVVACGDPQPTRQPTNFAPVAVDTRGVPRLLHAKTAPTPAPTPTDAARIHVAELAHAYRVAPTALPELVAAGEIRVRGGTIARLRQVIDGLPIDAGELRVLIRPDGSLATVSGTLVGNDTPRTPPRFATEVSDESGAIARAIRHTHNAAFDRGVLAPKGSTPGLAGASNAVVVELARAKQIWRRTGTRLTAAWLVEAYSSAPTTTAGDAFRTVIAEDGRILEHRSLVADADFQYRVFADPTGERHPLDGPIVDSTPHPTGTPNGVFPPYVTPSLVTVDGLNNKGGAPDPWLAVGATETNGNNVDAYADVNAPSGLSNGDFRATTTAAGVFDRVYDTAAQPLATQDQQMAAVTSLFFGINWLHDFWYDAGFTEAAGNGQASNFGRGGEEGDAIRAEAQDNANGGSRNNANMSTPSDGLPPRMQVFLWSGEEERSLAISNRTPATNVGSFGPNSFDITAEVILGVDGVMNGTDLTGTDACSALTNNVTGKIVLVDRGNCTFKSKAIRIQNAGGVGMLLANNVTSNNPPSMGNDTQSQGTVTIGSLSITMAEGAAIKADLLAGATSATLHRLFGTELDGSLDSTLVAHEFGHYLHHRLQSCGTRMCGAISEGWGDFLALMLIARAGDNLSGAYPFSVYTTQTFSSDAAYFGIRRAPYSVSKTINALSFRHMAEGEPLPTGDHPFNDFGSNSEVHNAGEIWAAAMWEAYVALQQAGTNFDEVRQKMAEYVVAGLLLAPADGSPTETRDAILAAAHAASQQDHDVLMAAFARRGLGSCAVSPENPNGDFTGIVESADVRGRAIPGIATLTDSVTSCDDDGILDAGETARITLPITNPGHAAVTDVTVAVTSPVTGVTVVSPPVALGTLEPYTTTMVDVDVQLDATLVDAIDGSISLDITTTNSCNDRVTTPIQVRLNVDELPASSATDSCDTAATLWLPATDSEVGWTQVFGSLDGHWHGADLGVAADTNLTSPVLTGDPAVPVVVEFTHSYQFEHSDGTAFDGGVIEVSIDNGATWVDVGDMGTTPGYGDIITADSGNPLADRVAYTNENANFPGTDTVRLDFGTQLADKQFQIRFRIGTDQAAGAEGWTIDDIKFTGIVGTPFASVVPDATDCDGIEPPPGEDGGCCDAGPMRPGNALLALGVLALIARRRRRK